MFLKLTSARFCWRDAEFAQGEDPLSSVSAPISLHYSNANTDQPQQRGAFDAPRIAIWLFGLALGFLPRVYFASSHGSWDTEYWKAWASHAATVGYTQYYGDASSIPAGEFRGQLSGQLPRHEVRYRDRSFPIDYPPLGLLAWAESWRIFTSKPRPYRGAEAENLAVKFPALLGDFVATCLLAFLFRSEPTRAVALSLAYWLFPLTWISSAAHGFFDGFLAPLLLIALIAVRRSPFWGGVLFACVVFVKPTAAVAVFALFLGVSRSAWPLVALGGATGSAAVLLPYALAGTLPTAFVHIIRIFSQDRISGGYANPWWLAGHLLNVATGRAGWAAIVDYVRRDSFPMPAGTIGFVAAGLAAAYVLSKFASGTRREDMCLAGSGLLFVWGMLTVGVHDNHNHPLFLLLLATGLRTRFLRLFALALAVTTFLGSVALHGIGRFYGPQWKPVLRLAEGADHLRMALGFDVTLILVAANTILLVCLFVHLSRRGN